MNKYLSYDGEHFYFKDNVINKILDSDIAISNEVYNTFFDKQSQGKQFKLKNINGGTFDDIFEEYTPEITIALPSLNDRITSIESALRVMLGV